jgi:hypothetical protein
MGTQWEGNVMKYDYVRAGHRRKHDKAHLQYLSQGVSKLHDVQRSRLRPRYRNAIVGRPHETLSTTRNQPSERGMNMKTKLFVVEDDRAQWLMRSDDFRMDPKWGYRVLCEAKRVKKNEVRAGLLSWRVYPDWSLRAI